MFPSNYIFYGTTNKSLSIYDIVTEQVVTTFDNAHDRPIHTISIHEQANNQSDCNLILTSACDSSIKLWDIRTMHRCIRKFTQHKNHVHTIGSSINSNSQWVMTGSEDRCIYLYDVLSGSLLHKLQGCHSDVVTSTQFCSTTMAASCSLDSKVNFYLQ
jgi:WD40 repeat protein